MKTHIEIIEANLAQVIAGEPVPSFQGPEFAALMQAIKAMTAPDREAYMGREVLGAKVLQLLLERIDSSMQAERALAIMRHNAKPSC